MLKNERIRPEAIKLSSLFTKTYGIINKSLLWKLRIPLVSNPRYRGKMQCPRRGIRPARAETNRRSPKGERANQSNLRVELPLSLSATRRNALCGRREWSRGDASDTDEAQRASAQVMRESIEPAFGSYH